jgi:hypothetical protein
MKSALNQQQQQNLYDLNNTTKLKLRKNTMLASTHDGM